MLSPESDTLNAPTSNAGKKRADRKGEGSDVSLSKIILSILGVAGVIAVAFVAPNVVQLLDLGGRRRRFPRKQFKTALNRLEKKGVIRAMSDRTSWHYALTSEGKELLEKKKIDDISIAPPKEWDGKWRLVIFDVPEQHRKARNALRSTLQRLGFRYLNLSVWVHPFPCQRELSAVVEYFGVGEYVRYVTAESFDGAEALKPKFGKLLERVCARQRLIASE
jgi:DNA-binding transcriptional regulator PaaX